MNKINNKHGIEMYYEFSTEEEKMYIFDTNGKYFDDMRVCLDDKKDKQMSIEILEKIPFQNMCDVCYKRIYNSLEELQYDLQDPEITEDNDYVNVFKVNDKKYYVWSE